MKALEPVQTWLQSLAPRERTLVVWGGAAAVVLIFLGAIVLPLYSAVSTKAQRIEQKQNDLGWMRSVAGELRAAGPSSSNPGANQSLVVIVDQSAQQAGLGTTLTGSQPSGNGGIRVRLENAAFDTIVGWLATLEQQYKLTAETASVDRGAQPGVVNASIVLRKAG